MLPVSLMRCLLVTILVLRGDDPAGIGRDGFTARQRFFLAHSYSWCRNWRPQLAPTVITREPHSLPQFRVHNVESNMPEFQQAFRLQRWSAHGAGQCPQSVVAV
jgi:predicted metalloendopeptidase